MEAAKAVKYRPISAARTLRTRRSHLLALMVPYIETPFNPLFAAAVQREAEKSNGFVAQTYRLSEDDIGIPVEDAAYRGVVADLEGRLDAWQTWSADPVSLD